MRTTSLFLGVLLAASATSSAQAIELQLRLGGQSVSDEGIYTVASSPQLTLTGFRLTTPSQARPRLNFVVGFQRSTSDSFSYNYLPVYEEEDEEYYYNESSQSLALNNLEAGILIEHPISRTLVPYVSVTAQAMAGKASFSDAVTGWTVYDPSSPDTDEPLYQREPTVARGFAGGVRASVGIALRFNYDSKPVDYAMLMPLERNEFSMQEAPVSPQEKEDAKETAPATAPDVENAPTIDQPLTPPVEPQAPELEVAPVTPTPPVPPSVPPVEKSTPAHSTQTPIPEGQNESWVVYSPRDGKGIGWGFQAEVGYQAVSGMDFGQMGTLQLSNVQLHLGMMLQF